MEDDVHTGKRNLLSFDATELSKMDMISKSCSHTGETLQFDIIKREGYDEIMEAVANQTSSQSEEFARSQRDTMEALASVTRYVVRKFRQKLCRRRVFLHKDSHSALFF